MLASQAFQPLLRHGHCQALPVDHRVHGGACIIEQFPVLDVQQCLDYRRGYRCEVRVDLARVARFLYHLPVHIEQFQPGLGFLRVHIEHTASGEFAQPARGHSLTGDTVTLLQQALCETRQLRVTEPHIPGTAIRSKRRARRPPLDVIADGRGKICQHAGLEGGVAHFIPCEVTQRQRAAQHNHPQRHPQQWRKHLLPQAGALAPRRDRGAVAGSRPEAFALVLALAQWWVCTAGRMSANDTRGTRAALSLPRPGTVSPNRLLLRFERLLFRSQPTNLGGTHSNGNARQQEQEHWGSEPAER